MAISFLPTFFLLCNGINMKLIIASISFWLKNVDFIRSLKLSLLLAYPDHQGNRSIIFGIVLQCYSTIFHRKIDPRKNVL